MHASFIEIYNTNDMHKRFNDLNRDGKERIKGFLDYSIRLKVKKSISELSKIEKKLRNDFPNFTPAIDHVFASLKIGAGSDTKGVYFSPLLMVGPPGIGKTYFSKRLSKDLTLAILCDEVIDLSAISEISVDTIVENNQNLFSQLMHRVSECSVSSDIINIIGVLYK